MAGILSVVFVAWLLSGLIIGALAGLIMKSQRGLLGSMVIGLIGSILGGVLASLLGFHGGWLFSIIGACLLIAVLD